MNLRLTPDVLARAYDFLSECNPFVDWALPPSEDEVKFKVVRTKRWYADCSRIRAGQRITYLIRVSQGTCGHNATLQAAMAHEMIHIHQWRLGDRANHNDLFDRLAKEVCAVHGFDIRAF